MYHEWRSHPRLKGRFHPQHYDDLQVLVHDGGPRLADKPPELVWVTVTASDGDIFRGRVLSQPHGLARVRQGDEIRFLVPDGGNHPILVSQKYLDERRDWVINPCNRCGLSELFDAPSDLIERLFPNRSGEEVPEALTSFCPLCGGVQVVIRKEAAEEMG